MPAKIRDDLPPGTIEAFCARLPNGDEALDVYRLVIAKAEGDDAG